VTWDVTSKPPASYAEAEELAREQTENAPQIVLWGRAWRYGAGNVVEAFLFIRSDINSALASDLWSVSAFVFELLDDGLLAFGRFPAFEEIIEADESLFQGLFREILQALGDEPAFFVEIFHALSDDSGPYPIDIDFARLFLVCVDTDIRLDDDNLVFAGRRRNGRVTLCAGIVRRGHGVICAGLINLHRLAIKIRVREVIRSAPEINQCEIKLLGVLVNASAAPDNLLELRHAARGTVKHDESAKSGRPHPWRADAMW
jgi:hypothetical protein